MWILRTRICHATRWPTSKASDLVVTSKIASRGFKFSPDYSFERPFAKDFPEDPEKSYLREQQEALGNKRKLFTVVEIDKDRHVPRTLKSQRRSLVLLFGSSPAARHQDVTQSRWIFQDRKVISSIQF